MKGHATVSQGTRMSGVVLHTAFSEPDPAQGPCVWCRDNHTQDSASHPGDSLVTGEMCGTHGSLHC